MVKRHPEVPSSSAGVKKDKILKRNPFQLARGMSVARSGIWNMQGSHALFHPPYCLGVRLVFGKVNSLHERLSCHRRVRLTCITN